jgi:alkaline phosphatase
MKLLLFTTSFFFLFCVKQEHESQNITPFARKPKNIILLIGDGMGLTQVTAGMYANGNRTPLERMPVTGLIKTHSSDKLITDSAAGATAFSCGCKTYNGAIGVSNDKRPCNTILEQAKVRGLACGLVATSSVTHATPASFIAHVAQRAEMEEIATWFVQNPIDLFLGGGQKYFTQRTEDKRNLRDELTQKGVKVFDFSEKKIEEIPFDPKYPLAWFSALEEPESVLKGRDYLRLATQKSTEFLSKRSEKGFFLMVEGSQIDWACHANDAERAVAETLDFNAAVAEALDFAQRDGQTLVLVTADHETGGMAIQNGSTQDSLDIHFNSGGHTAVMVPVFAYGPGSSLFNGIYDNTQIYWKMAKLWEF